MKINSVLLWTGLFIICGSTHLVSKFTCFNRFNKQLYHTFQAQAGIYHAYYFERNHLPRRYDTVLIWRDLNPKICKLVYTDHDGAVCFLMLWVNKNTHILGIVASEWQTPFSPLVLPSVTGGHNKALLAFATLFKLLPQSTHPIWSAQLSLWLD